MVKLFGRNTSIYSAFEIKRRFPALRLHRHGNHTHFNCNFVGAHTSKDHPKQLVSWQREEKYQQQMSTLNSIRVQPKGTPHRFAIGSLLNQTSSNRSLQLSQPRSPQKDALSLVVSVDNLGSRDYLFTLSVASGFCCCMLNIVRIHS